MGCCHSELKLEANSTPKLIKEIIEKNSIKYLTKYLSSPEFLSNKEKSLDELDDVICSIRSLKFNSLGYALFLGRNTIFQTLHKAGCSLTEAENLLQKQGIPIITLICSKGYTDILTYYLPIYVENHNNDRPFDKTFTIDLNLESDIKAAQKITYSAIQLAVQYGHITIVTMIHDYFKDFLNIPFELDLEYQDEGSGENCALLACRFGNYPMVKFLHQKCGANFLIKNKLGESAVQIAAAGSRLHPHLQYLQIICYLVDVAEVDIKYNYEETLLLAEDKEIISFIEKKLKGKGIGLKKAELEKEDESGRKNDKEKEDVDALEAKRFNFLTMYAVTCGDKDESLASSISERHSVGSLFGSTLSEFHK